MRVAPSHNADGGSEGGEARSWFRCGQEGTPPSAAAPRSRWFHTFSLLRSHRGSVRSQGPVVLALALTVTRSQCPGDI